MFRLGVEKVTNERKKTYSRNVQKSNQSVLGQLPYTYRRSLYQLIVIKYKVKCIKVVDYKVRRWYNGFTEIRKGANET